MPITQTENGGFVATGQGVRVYQAVALKHGMTLYLKTGMKPNRAWTPKAMLATATRITGNSYKGGKGGLTVAIADLTAWINAQNPEA